MVQAGASRSEEDGKVLRNPFAHALDGKAMPGFYPVGQSRQVSKPVRKYRHRKNVTLEGWDGVNPADMEPTEYDLNYEDPDLYDFIAD